MCLFNYAILDMVSERTLPSFQGMTGNNTLFSINPDFFLVYFLEEDIVTRERIRTCMSFGQGLQRVKALKTRDPSRILVIA